MKFSIKEFFIKSDQIHRKLRIWSHLLNNSLMENFIFLCSVRSRDQVFLQNIRKFIVQILKFFS